MHVINFHILEQCNYGCKYCFAKFGDTFLNLKDTIKVIDSILEYFQKNNFYNGRINFAGGEPLLYPYLDTLIDYIAEKGYQSSIITNGALLTKEKIALWQKKISCIGISVDSIDNETNLQIGRHTYEKTLEISKIKELAKQIHKCGIQLKINTVISKYNIDENLLPLYLEIKPNKIKFLQMHVVKDINDSVKELGVSKEAFLGYCEIMKTNINKELPNTKVVIEEKGSMENSYIMVAPDGSLLVNCCGEYKNYGNLLYTSIITLYSNLPLNQEKIEKRYR